MFRDATMMTLRERKELGVESKLDEIKILEIKKICPVPHKSNTCKPKCLFRKRTPDSKKNKHSFAANLTTIYILTEETVLNSVHLFFPLAAKTVTRRRHVTNAAL
jgi:hypothetical protein